MTTATATKPARTLRWDANTDEMSPTAGALTLTTHTGSVSYIVCELPTGMTGTRGFQLTRIDGGAGYAVVCGVRGDSCECPDSLFRRRSCKHSLAVRKLLEMGKI